MKTYKATGINLKSIPFGESDRLVTILTREFGLVRAVAPGVRQPKSRLGARCGLFVVNDLLLYEGRSLDKIVQAETRNSYAGLSQNLGKLTAAQYLAEIVLCQALDRQPQEELFVLFEEHLQRIEQIPGAIARDCPARVVARLAHGIYHLLALAGVAPQVHYCCTTRTAIAPNFSHPQWQIGFSHRAGGLVSLSAIAPRQPLDPYKSAKIDGYLDAIALVAFQHLSAPELSAWDSWGEKYRQSNPNGPTLDTVWVSVEQLLRNYAQYHLGISIRSAALMDTYINSAVFNTSSR